MPDQNNENTQPTTASPEPPAPKKQLSPLALWSFRFFVFGLACAIAATASFYILPNGAVVVIGGLFGSLAWLAAVLLGLAAMFHIGRKRKQFKGVLRSTISVFIPVIVCSVWLYFTISLAYRLMCGANVNGLGKALSVYCNDYGKISSHWNDLLVERADVHVRQFMCRGSDAITGECSYAMNKYIVEMNMSQLPSDIVVLFETDYGKTASRWWRKHPFSKDNNYYSVTESNGVPKLIRSDKLDKLRWNQVGGPEMLTTNHHRGKGCIVLFGDSHVDFIKPEDIPKLRWKP